MKKASWGCWFKSSIRLANLLFIQILVTLVLRVVLGLSLSLGASRHARMVLAPQYTLPWIMSQVWIGQRFVLGEI